MSDPASSSPQPWTDAPSEAPLASAGRTAPLPADLYGTRAALFHLLREAPPAAGFVPSPAIPRLVLASPIDPVPTTSAATTPAPTTPAPRAAIRPTARVVPMVQEPARPSRTAVQAMLMSDSFDFRDQV